MSGINEEMSMEDNETPGDGSTPNPIAAQSPQPKSKGFTLIAWVFIILFVTVTAAIQIIRKQDEVPEPKRIPSVFSGFTAQAQSQMAGPMAGVSELIVANQVDQARPDLLATEASPEELAGDFQLKYFVGSKIVLETFSQYSGNKEGMSQTEKQQLLTAMKPLENGTFAERIQFSIIAGEISSPKRAYEELTKIQALALRNEFSMTPENSKLLQALLAVYRDYNHFRFDLPNVSDAQKTLIQDSLGWLGSLALNHEGVSLDSDEAMAVGSPYGIVLEHSQGVSKQSRQQSTEGPVRLFLSVIGGVMGVCCFGVFGFFALALVLSLIGSGTITLRFKFERGHGGVYAETFALWFFIFMLLQVLVAIPYIPLPRIMLMPLSMFGSLLALVWPRLRGIPWSTVLDDIGWTRGAGFLQEISLGFLTYLMSLPLLAAGGGLMLVLAQIIKIIKEALGDPTAGNELTNAAHPVVPLVVDGTLLDRILLFVLAAVAAPIVEETMFRGVLYRQLRESTGGWAKILSILASMTLVSFIFAVIHPQGIVAIPALMGLALGFNIAREWRGSIIPCIIAHGISNGLIMGLLFFILQM